MLQSNITHRRGDLFESPMSALTNTVNTVGVMGAGIAKLFKRRYPAMFAEYKAKCERQSVKVGEPYVWKSNGADGKWVVNFPTKKHWRAKSQILWIEAGLEYLLARYKDWELKSLALPALGCDLGGLNWDDVRPIMEMHLGKLDIPVEIYEPMRRTSYYSYSPAERVEIAPDRQGALIY